MTPHYTDPWLTVYLGDCREVMAQMEPESVHCVVTSPPYWGLRDYGTATWIGGDEACDHRPDQRPRSERPMGKLQANKRTPIQSAGTVATVEAATPPYRHTCGKCGAVRQDSQLGLESTPEEYVANMVAVFREVRRVLRSDGTVWLNLGDSYYTSPAGNTTPSGISQNTAKRAGKLAEYNTQPKTFPGLKPKDLVGIPWRVAFALQADGWYLRSDIIWSKPNPMPESVTDRPTKAHEYLFLLSKKSIYYYDADAVREEHAYDWNAHQKAMARLTSDGGWKMQDESVLHQGGQDRRFVNPPNPAGRNLRSVWTIATQPYPGAHFATFPAKLVEPCIKAGCPPDGVVLDPFAGSGTTGMVAQSLSRRAVLIDLSADYLRQLMDRNRDIPLGLESA